MAVSTVRPELSRLRGLIEATRLVRGGSDVTAVLARMARILRAVLGYQTVVINVYRPAWDDFCAAAVEGPPEARDALLGATYPLESWTRLLDPRFERRGAFHIPAGEFDWGDDLGARWNPSVPSAPDAGAWDPEDELFIPFRHSDGQLLGVLSLGEPISGNRPSDDELDVLVAIGDLAAAAVQSAQEASAAARYEQSLTELLRVSTKLADPAVDLPDMLQTVCDAIRSALGFQRVALALPDPQTGVFRARAVTGWSLEDPVAQMEYRVSEVEDLLDPTFEIAGCYVLTSAAAESRIERRLITYRSELNGSGPWAWSHHWLIVPLRNARADVVGLLWADDPIDRLVPSEHQLAMLRMFANEASMAIESSEQAARLRSAHDRRRRLLQRVVEAAESERRRVGAELHDGPIQRLSVQTISLETAKCLLGSGDPGGATKLVDGAQQALGEEIGMLRGLMTELRPPVLDERGLPAALKFLAEVIRSRYGASVRVCDGADEELGMDRESEIVLYRVAQEALTNAAKHAAAAAIEVELGTDAASVRLRVRDDGRGFDPDRIQVEEGHFGLVTMRERVDMVGGALEIRSAPGDGTEIVATIPTSGPQAAPDSATVSA